MVSSVYFTRHGRVHKENKVSDSGFADLSCVKKSLDEFGFSPTRCFSSKAPRCIQTAEFLAPDAKLYQLSTLFQFGPFEKFKALADSVIGVITHFKEEDILVVSHDDASLIYALRLAELHGAIIDWDHFLKNPRDRYVEQGEGILVSQNTYKRIHA